MQLDDDADNGVVPQRRYKREIVSELRVRLTRSEAVMMGDIQREVDLPWNQLIRQLIREEHRRMYGRVPVAFAELEAAPR